MRKRPKIGDICEIKTSKGFAYFQYTHKHPSYGSLIRILPGIYKERQRNFADLSQIKERFWIFFALGTACYRNIVQIVDHQNIPDFARIFPLMKIRGLGGDWWLWDGEKETKIGELPKQFLDLSYRRIANDSALINLIEDPNYPRSDPYSRQ